MKTAVNVLLLFIFCLTAYTPLCYGATSLQQRVNDTKQALDDKQQSLAVMEDKLRKAKQDILKIKQRQEELQLDIRTLDLTRKKILLLADGNPNYQEKKRLDTLLYKHKVAELELRKTEQRLEEINASRNTVRSRIRRLDNVLRDLNKQLATLQQQQSTVTQAEKTEKENARLRQQELQKLRQAQLAKQQALSKKTAKQAADRAAKLAAEEAAKANARAQQQKLANLQAQQRASAAAAASQKIMQQPLTNEHEAKKQQQSSQRTGQSESQVNMLLALAKRYQSKDITPAERLMQQTRWTAKQNSRQSAVFGRKTALLSQKDATNNADKVAMLKHLGNNQYMATFTMQSGKQTFWVRQHRFDKDLPAYFDGLEALVVVDARGATPKLQLLATGK